MKIENTNNHTYLLGTITEVCHTIGSIIEKDWKNGREFVFPKFYFGTIDEFEHLDKSLRQIAIATEGWHGCKSIENEFESSDMATILADYCGGGAAVAISLYLDDLYSDVVESAISSLMIKTLEIDEAIEKTLSFSSRPRNTFPSTPTKSWHNYAPNTRSSNSNGWPITVTHSNHSLHLSRWTSKIPANLSGRPTRPGKKKPALAAKSGPASTNGWKTKNRNTKKKKINKKKGETK